MSPFGVALGVTLGLTALGLGLGLAFLGVAFLGVAALGCFGGGEGTGRGGVLALLESESEEEEEEEEESGGAAAGEATEVVVVVAAVVVARLASITFGGRPGFATFPEGDTAAAFLEGLTAGGDAFLLCGLGLSELAALSVFLAPPAASLSPWSALRVSRARAHVRFAAARSPVLLRLLVLM
jgi:hypothetical protein